MDLHEIIANIAPPDETARRSARARWNACAKPLGSLGLLERAVEDVAALTGSAAVDLGEKAVLVLCADNGVVRQGVAQTGSGVTAAVARQLARRRTSVCRMAEVAHCRVVPVDMGIRGFAGFDGVLNRRIGDGTKDFSDGPAMTRAQAEQAIL
ncbi:MAG: nicotinate-nucleotide--dimethylbenzimidazole phosphoribosyltransferase, partial [Oscillospiraceae bacterium]|nr:nicotinate-nucleotide--dimethylbenzimidazole phosphoribosyltransferase [Oscillospiraceae bacterium]